MHWIDNVKVWKLLSGGQGCGVRVDGGAEETQERERCSSPFMSWKPGANVPTGGEGGKGGSREDSWSPGERGRWRDRGQTTFSTEK